MGIAGGDEIYKCERQNKIKWKIHKPKTVSVTYILVDYNYIKSLVLYEFSLNNKKEVKPIKIYP